MGWDRISKQLLNFYAPKDPLPILEQQSHPHSSKKVLFSKNSEESLASIKSQLKHERRDSIKHLFGGIITMKSKNKMTFNQEKYNQLVKQQEAHALKKARRLDILSLKLPFQVQKQLKQIISGQRSVCRISKDNISQSLTLGRDRGFDSDKLVERMGEMKRRRKSCFCKQCGKAK